MSRLGVVVFGAGIAGKVRIRDIGCSDGDNISWDLIGFVSRRQLNIDGVSQLQEEDVFSRHDVHAVVVCTEPGAHEPLIKKALDSGKHVLVEFPVVTSAGATQQLYDFAQQKGLILHEENIALLGPGFLSMKHKLQNLSAPIVKGELKLLGNYNGWAEDFEKSGGPFCVNVSLIQSMYELLGNDIIATGGDLEVTDDGFTATAQLSCAKCSDVTIILKRNKERSVRHKQMRFELADGTVVDDTPVNPAPPTQNTGAPKKPGLFMQDFLQFVGKVKQTRDPSSDAARTLRCIKIAEQIHVLMGLTK